ncbi:MAG: GNAT family N-acetyltransferase [Bacteroidales bacterium]|nr:GNAT family N-acetyltransferase [Bacteroidales bacterium]
MQITIKEVSGKKELKAFYQFQNKLYRNCAQYVPSLDMDQKSTLTEDPALEYCVRKMWLAYKGGEVVGRIQAVVNPRYNEFYNLKRVRFGWFDFVEDFNVAKALLDTAMAWGKEQGMTEVHGPLF